MRSIVSVCTSGILAALLLGCNGGGQGGQGAASASAGQKIQLQEVKASRAAAQQAIPVSSPVAPDLGLIEESALAAFNGDLQPLARALGAFEATGANEALIGMQDKLMDAVEHGRCTITKDGLNGASNADVAPLSDVYGSLDVEGPGCPITFNLSISSDMPTEGGLGISYAAKYEVLDPSYRALNDVDSFSVTVKFGVITNGEGQASQTTTMSAAVDTKIHSQKYGTLVETGRGTGSGSGDSSAGAFRAGFEMTVTDTIGSFEVDRAAGFSMDNRGEKSFHYALNGVPVSKEEFEAFGKVDLPGSAN